MDVFRASLVVAAIEDKAGRQFNEYEGFHRKV